MSDNLQELADSIREDLRRGGGGHFQINHPELDDPLLLDVSPDGIMWLVRVTCGERVLYDATGSTCVKPDEFLSSLYVFLRAAIKAAKTPAEKLS